jgi:Concanavalin A-like lectin/glucanases superfamily
MRQSVLVSVCLFLLFANATATQADYKGTILADNPVAYYRLGETSAITAVDIAASTPNNNGAYGGLPTLGVPGLIADPDSAVNFRGFGDVTISDASDLNFVNAPYTIEAWVKLTSATSTFDRVFDKVGANTPYGYGLDLTSSQLRILGSQNVVANFAFVTNSTYYVAGVSDGSGSASLYVNGMLIGIGSYGSPNPYIGPAHIAAGSDLSSLFPGVIDEVAVYNRSLSPGQIRAHFNAGQAVPETSSSMLAALGLLGLAIYRGRTIQ